MSLYPARRLWKPRAWQLLFGPASIADGVCETLTLGRWSPSLRLTVSRNLMLAELEHLKRNRRP